MISEARKPTGGTSREWGGELEDVMGSARGTYTPDMVFLLRPNKEAQTGREGGHQPRVFHKLTIAKGRDGVRRGDLDLTFFYNLSLFTQGMNVSEDFDEYL